MDIFPQSKLAEEGIEAWNKICTIQNYNICGIDVNHRCTEECKYFVFKNEGAVCKASRHTHFCRGKKCTLCVEKNSGSFCALTGRQLFGEKLKTYANLASTEFGKRKSNVHWTNAGKKKPRKNMKNAYNKRVREIIHTLFISSERSAITTTARQKVRLKMATLLKSRTIGAFFQASAYALKMASSIRGPPSTIPENLTAYIVDQTLFIQNECIRRNIKCKTTDTNLVLGLLQLLETGFVVNNSVLVTPSTWIQTYSVSLQQLGNFSGFRCRAQTRSVRLCKGALVTSEGEPLTLLPPPPC